VRLISKLTIAEDKAMLERIGHVVEQLYLDAQFPVETDMVELERTDSGVVESNNDSVADEDVALSIVASQYRGNRTLKQFVTTRWNSSLIMIRSILNLKVQVQAALKKTGHMELCFYDSELSLLKELHDFIEPFEVMTVIASSSSTVLSFVPLIKVKIQKLCSTDDTLGEEESSEEFG